MKNLIRSTVVAATIALMSAMPVSADDSTCELPKNGVSLTDSGAAYICNFDIDYPPFDTVDTYADPTLHDHRWGRLYAYENGSFLIPIHLQNGSSILFRGCGIPSLGCDPAESLQMPLYPATPLPDHFDA